MADASIDSVVCNLVLCTALDPAGALREIARVLRPGGQLLFVEHVRADTAGWARWQERTRAAGAPSRAAVSSRARPATLQDSPLEVVDVKRGRCGPCRSCTRSSGAARSGRPERLRERRPATMLAVSHPEAVVPQTLQQILDERARTLVGRDQSSPGSSRWSTRAARSSRWCTASRASARPRCCGRSPPARAPVVRPSCSSTQARSSPPNAAFAALAGALDDGAVATLDQAAERLAGVAERVVLVVDTLERLRLLDDWLRQRFVPALPDNVASCSPAATSQGQEHGYSEVLAVVPLANLTAADAEGLLRRAGVREADLRRVNRLAHGHPLSLRLAASALAARLGLTLEHAVVPAVIDQLTSLYLGSLLRHGALWTPPPSCVGPPARCYGRCSARARTRTRGGGWTPCPSPRPGRTGSCCTTPSARRSTPPCAPTTRAGACAARGRLQPAARRGTRCACGALALHRRPALPCRGHSRPRRVLSHQRTDLHGRPRGRRRRTAHRRHHPPPPRRARRGHRRRWWRAVPTGFRVARDRAGEVAAFLLLCEPGRGRRPPHQPRSGRRAAWREDLHRSLPREQRVSSSDACSRATRRGAGRRPGGALGRRQARLHGAAARPATRICRGQPA